MEERCFFLETDAGRVIGTATAWHHPSFHGARYGRLHWVAIHPEFQGRKLAKPLVGAAMRRLAELHRRAYLTTQTTSWKAVKIYLDFGFEPLAETPRWRRLAAPRGDHRAPRAGSLPWQVNEARIIPSRRSPDTALGIFRAARPSRA